LVPPKRFSLFSHRSPLWLGSSYLIINRLPPR
jgi:hypothetical protein